MLPRRTFLYSLASVAVLSNDELTKRSGRPLRAGATDIERIRAMNRMFGDADDLYGGGQAHGRGRLPLP